MIVIYISFIIVMHLFDMNSWLVSFLYIKFIINLFIIIEKMAQQNLFA